MWQAARWWRRLGVLLWLALLIALAVQKPPLRAGTEPTTPALPDGAAAHPSSQPSGAPGPDAPAHAARQPVGWVAGAEISALTLWRDGERAAVLEAQRRAGFNTLFVTVKQFDGRLWYYTDRFPQLMATPAPGLAYTPEENPLTKILDDARRSQPRQAVMALFQAFQDKYAARVLFPEARIGNLDWVDPAYRPMQDYLIELAVDLVRRYPIDGISLDFIRYPTGVRDEDLPFTGHRSRIEVISEFVRRFVTAIRAVDPTIDISANIFPEAALAPAEAIGQDAVALAKAGLDFVLPMNYPYDDGAPGREADRERYQRQRVARALARGLDPDFIKPDVQGFFGYSFGEVAAQIRGVRAGGGTGALVYAYDFEMGWDPEAWAVLAREMPAGASRRFRQDRRPPGIQKPRVQGATVTLRTDEPATVTAVWTPVADAGTQPASASGDAGATAATGATGGAAGTRRLREEGAPRRDHALLLPDLKPGQTYEVRLEARDLDGNVATAGPLRFTYQAPPSADGSLLGAVRQRQAASPAGVAVTDVTGAWATVRWRTAVPATSVVEYGPTPRLGRRLEVRELTTEHALRLTDLRPGQTLYYRVRGLDAYGREVAGPVTRFQMPVNLALGRPATASSTIRQGFEASRATDGSLQTRWSSRYEDRASLTVDLGRPQRVAAVGLEWEYAYARAYRIDVSPDGQRWTTVYETSSGNGGREDVRFAPVTARYVRVVTAQRGTPLGNSLWELEVYGP